jgi:SSS family transporter
MHLNFLKFKPALDWIDLAIVAAYLAGITLFGLRFRKKQRSLRDYFLADQNIPWPAIALSIVAAETSTLTIIGTPALAYDTNLGFLQLVLGYLVARVLISIILIPKYFAGRMMTAYQLMETRFGRLLRSITAGLFLVTRALAEGVRVFAISIVIGTAIGTNNDILAIAIVTVLTLIYTFEGGMAAVIWTDVVQMIIYVGGTIVGFFTILHLVPGGWPVIHAAATTAGKFQVFDFSRSLFKTYTFWSGIVGGTFLTMASHGVDQLLVQRLLAAKRERDAKKALIASGFAVLFQFTLFLLVGVMLYVYYRQFPPAVPFARSDRIFPTFIVQHMPIGISGLLVAAILAAAMSNLSAALNSLSASSIVDFYGRLRPGASDTQKMRLSRTATVLWALVLFALALLARHSTRVLETGLSIASVPYGAMLGVFLLGVLTRRANQIGAIVGMLFGFALNLYLWQGTIMGKKIPFTWYVVFGTVATFVVGYVCSLFTAASTPSPRVSSQSG